MSWRDVGFLVVGLFVGANVGLLVMGLCVAARRGDELAHGSWLMADREKTGDGGRETEDWERRVVFEKRTMISKRCAAPRAPKGKPTVPAPPPPPGPEKGRQRIENEWPKVMI